MAFFNQLNVDLNDKTHYPDDIYEQTLENPNPAVSASSILNQDSLNDYTNQLTDEVLTALASNSGEVI